MSEQNNMMKAKRVLITGGAGAIGSNIAHELAARGSDIVILDDLSSGYRDLVPDGSRFIEGSIVDDAAVKAAFDPAPDYVIHAAALFANQNSVDHPQDDITVNGLGLIKVLEQCTQTGVRKMLFCSSSCVYGGKAVMREDDIDLHPDTPYAITKWLGERYVRYWADYHKLNAISVRFFNIYGPGERPGRYRNVIPNFFALAMRGETLKITGTGAETRDFTFMSDAVAGVLGAIAAETTPGDIFNIGSGRATTILELATAINAMTGNGGGIEFVPRRAWDQVPHRVCDNALARKAFDFDSSVPLDEGLAKTYAWLKRHYSPA